MCIYSKVYEINDFGLELHLFLVASISFVAENHRN